MSHDYRLCLSGHSPAPSPGAWHRPGGPRHSPVAYTAFRPVAIGAERRASGSITWPTGGPQVRNGTGVSETPTGVSLVQAMWTHYPIVGVNDCLKDAAALLETSGAVLLPVVDDGYLVGTLSATDLAFCLANGGEGHRCTVRDATRPAPPRCTPDATLEQVRALMCQHRQPAVVVTERDGHSVVGVIDAFQVLAALGPVPAAAGPEPDQVRRVRGGA